MNKKKRIEKERERSLRQGKEKEMGNGTKERGKVVLKKSRYEKEGRKK